jgi:hypothetical protein
MFEIMKYYTKRNESKTYSYNLHSEIKQKLKNLDFTIALPQKTFKTNVFYLTHNHISVFFSFLDNDFFVKTVWDDRINPQKREHILRNID